MARKKVATEAAVVEAAIDEPVEVETEPTREPGRVVKYAGGGFLLGIPARDLSLDEWDALSEPERAAALQSQMFAIGGE